MKPVTIFGAAVGIGARDRRCEGGPEALRRLGIAQALNALWGGIYAANEAPDANAVATAIARLSADLAAVVDATVRAQSRFLVLGGDHSCAIGTWSGAARGLDGVGPMGLLWIDAHLDSHTPQTTPSGAIHGMPVATLLGYGDPVLAGIGMARPKVAPEHLAIVGVRSYEEGEYDLLERLGVRVWYIEEVQRRGLDAVMRDALQRVRYGTAGYGVTVDLDAIDPSDAPGVGSPVPGGIRGADLVRELARVNGDPRLLGLEVAEYNPSLDRADATARLVFELAGAVLAEGRNDVAHQNHRIGERLLRA